MSVRVYERGTERELMSAHRYECEVQPPVWCDAKDPAVLEIHLQSCAKLKYLFDTRKKISANNTDVAFLKDKDWSVRGTLLEYH